MADLCNACAAMGDACARCEQTGHPGELPTQYVPLTVHAAAARLVRAGAADERATVGERRRANRDE